MQNAAYLQSEKNMPANLNALIRYRTIDLCLSNPYRYWTIEDLMEACSKALEESRGIYTGISERTIREDIRVMRSDILGFNAPIVQKDGNYSYEDREYSIFNVSIRETDLLSRVLDFILEIQSEIQHPDMQDIIKRITRVISAQKEHEELKKPTPKKDQSRIPRSGSVPRRSRNIRAGRTTCHGKYSVHLGKHSEPDQIVTLQIPDPVFNKR
jgi:hypothetical protein